MISFCFFKRLYCLWFNILISVEVLLLLVSNSLLLQNSVLLIVHKLLSIFFSNQIKSNAKDIILIQLNTNHRTKYQNPNKLAIVLIVDFAELQILPAVYFTLSHAVSATLCATFAIFLTPL